MEVPMDKKLDTIKDEEILEMRKATDDISMSLFNQNFIGTEGNLILINYLNLFLIESFNWFATEGLATIFTNRELVIPNIGIVRIVDRKLEFPRKDDLGEQTSLLWPAEAVLGNVDYSGYLMVKAEVTWDSKIIGKTGTEPLSADWFPLGKIPIMVGSSFCNLSSIKNVKDLVRVKECSTEYMGYFVSKGNKRNLISQNYLKANNDICIFGKMGSGTSVSTYSQTMCNLRSRGLDGDMKKAIIFIMSLSNNKIAHSDRRIYFQITAPGWTKKNAYDSGLSVVGINIVSIFRLALILIHTIDPLAESTSYLFGDLPGDPNQGIPDMKAGYRGRSTFAESADRFKSFVYDYAGDKFWNLIQNYVTDTVNEASLEEDEMNFWNQTIRVADADQNDQTSTREKAIPLLDIFAQQLFPHLSSSPIKIQLREIRRLRDVARMEILRTHQENQMGTHPMEIDKSMAAIRNIYEMYRNRDPNMAEAVANLKATRKIDLSKDCPDCNYAVQLYEVIKRDMRAKLQLLAFMTVKVLRVELGIDTYDNRDSLANQSFEHAGLLMTNRFSAMLRDIEKGLADIKVANPDLIRGKLQTLGISIITKEFSENFSKGEWHSKTAGKPRTGVTDIMPSSIIAAQLAYLRRVSAHSTGHSKNTASRELSGLQLGAICLSETPEGKQCGSVEHLAATAFITNESFDSQTLAYRLVQKKTSRRHDVTNINIVVRLLMSKYNSINEIYKMADAKGQPLISEIKTPEKDTPLIINEQQIGWINKLTFDVGLIEMITKMTMSKDNLMAEIYKITDPTGELPISELRKPNRDTPLFLNGRPMGWVDGLVFRRKLIDMRRKGYIHPHTGIHFYQKPTQVGLIRVLKIETTGGRIVQPLIIAENPQKTLNILWALRGKDQGVILDMVAEGVIEFIDSAELEFLDLAPSVDVYLKSIQNGLPGRFDHIMLNPAFLMGVAANIMPFANMNPVVRNSYFTQMVKQPYGIPAANFLEGAHTSIAKLHSPQKPLVRTAMHDKILENDLFGMNVNILITTHREGEEDGIIVNKRFLDLGGLSSTKYSAFHVPLERGQELDFENKFMETAPDPDRYGRGLIRVTKKILKQNPDGTTIIVEEPVIVKPHEILARKTWIKEDVQKNAFSTVSYDSLREGIVDRILWSKGVEGSKNIYIVIKTPDDLWIGDKLYSRYSQKGVIAAVVPNDKMPFDANTGETPDLIINPQAFPSRMTIGMLAEVLVANAHIFPDKNKNVYLLYEERGFDIYAPLERLFIVEKKIWDNYNFDNEKVIHEEHTENPDKYGTEKEGQTKIPIPNQREAHKLVQGAYSEYYKLVKTALNEPAVKLENLTQEEIIRGSPLQGGYAGKISDQLPVVNDVQPVNPFAAFQPQQFQPQTFQPQQPAQPQQPFQSEKKEYVVIPSEMVSDQDSMKFLKDSDETIKFPGFENGLWGLRFYNKKETKVSNVDKWKKNIGDAKFFIVQSPGLNPSILNQSVDQSMASLNDVLDLTPEFREYLVSSKNNAGGDIYGWLFPADFIEPIEDIWFDLEQNIDEELVNPMRGIRISQIPNNPVQTSFEIVGNSLRQIYIRGNAYTPVADQYIADYRSNFFQRSNIKRYNYDFIIPENMRTIRNITIPEENYARDFMLPPGTTYKNLEQEKRKIQITTWIKISPTGGEMAEERDGTLIEAWNRLYPPETLIPRENIRTETLVSSTGSIIGGKELPEKAKDIFLKRKEKITELREASLFKAGLDVNDAMKELELMGYNADATREYINPENGKPIQGAIAGGWSFYMGSKHKVEEKMQARGEGRHDARTGQPIQGKNYGGGIRFNFADARAVIVSGAAGVVSDRLLEASNRKDIFVCNTCNEVCYRKSGIQSIVCPICRQETETTKISVPYTFLLERNLLMGAGMRLKIETIRDKDVVE